MGDEEWEKEEEQERNGEWEKEEEKERNGEWEGREKSEGRIEKEKVKEQWMDKGGCNMGEKRGDKGELRRRVNREEEGERGAKETL